MSIFLLFYAMKGSLQTRYPLLLQIRVTWSSGALHWLI